MSSSYFNPHKGPLYSHFQDGAFVSAIRDPALDPSSAVHVQVPTGGVSLHHGFTVHGLSANLSHHSRGMFALINVVQIIGLCLESWDTSLQTMAQLTGKDIALL